MEKSGMACRFREHPGLLRIPFRLALCLVLAFFPASARGESGPTEPLAVVLSRSPERPREGSPITVTIFIDHPRPAEVTVAPPAVSPGISLDRVKIGPRSLPGTSSGGERWTAAEYVFSAAATGEYRIGAFRIRAGDRTAETAPLSIVVENAEGEKPPATLSWQGVPSVFVVGEPASVRLVLIGASIDPAVRPAFSIPESAIFSEESLSASDIRAGVAARFKVTLLDAVPFRLPAATLSLSDGSFAEAVPLAVQVVPGSSKRTAASGRRPGAASGGPNPALPAEPPPFPKAAVPSLLRSWLEPECREVQSHWDRRDYVSALASVRASERDRTLGIALRPIRRTMEELLGLDQSLNERNAPFVPLLSIVVISTVIALIAGVTLVLEFLRFRDVTSARRRRFIIACAAAGIFALSAWRLIYAAMDSRDSVVVSACRALRVPDPESAVSSEFPEGQAGRVRSRTGDGAWLFIELPDGRSGWIETVYARPY